MNKKPEPKKAKSQSGPDRANGGGRSMQEILLENRRLRRGLQATGIGTYFWNVVEDTLEWDDCSLTIYGMTREQFSGDISDWENALHPDDREKTLKFLDKYNAERATEWDREFRIVRPSGEVRYVHAEGFFERDDKGDLLYIYGIHRDVTERRMEEKKIHRSEEFLQTLLDTSPVPIYIVSKDTGRFLMANAAVGELHKLPVDDLLKHNTREMYSGAKGRNLRTQLVRQIEETGRLDDFDLEARRIGTGELCWISVSARLIDYQGEEAILSVTQDITERKEAEEKIRHSEEFLQTLLDTSPIAISISSMKDGRFLRVNPAVAEAMKLSQEELLKHSTNEIYANPDDLTEITRRFQEAGRVNNFDIPALRIGTGEKCWLSLSATAIDYEGRKATLTVAYDITARKKADESLKHQSALVDLLRQTASDANEATDFKQGAEVCLRSINAYTGWPVGHVYLLSEEDDDLLVPSHIWYIENKKRFKAIFDVSEKTTFKRGVGLPGRVLESGEPAWIKDVTVDPNFPRSKMVDEVGVKGAFAFPVWAASKVVAVFEFFDEEPSEPDESLLQTVTHIGSQLGRLYEREKASTSLREARDAAQKAEAEIRRSEEQISSIFRTAIDGILSLDSQGHIIGSNEALSKLTGYSEEELIGKFAGLIVPEHIQDATAKGINRIFGGNIENLLDQVSEGRLLSKDGTVIPIDFSLAVWETKDSTVYTCIIRDVTEKKQQDAELREARDTAEEATRAKDMFLATMSHEIRTPMNGVVGMIELLQRTTLADDQQRMLETAKDSSFVLLTIINDILDFSKIEAGKMEIENVSFDLRKAADTVGEMLGLIAAEKRLPLVVHVQPDVPAALLGDPVRIRQILFNLAGNAVKFTEEGAVHVGICVAKTHKKGAVDILYEVKDSGIGMSKKQVGRLFAPFEQAETATTRQFGGTGLGLSIVRRLTDLMGGEIEVDSKPRMGSTFRVTIRHAVPKGAAEEAPGAEIGSRKVLALSNAGCRLDLLTQLLVHTNKGSIDRISPTTKTAALLKMLTAAEKDGEPYQLVYLSEDVGTNEQDRLRKIIEASDKLETVPRFVVERHNAAIAQDLPGSVLIPAIPYTESNLVRGLLIVLGKASPEIGNQAEGEGWAIEVPTIAEAESAGTLILVAEDDKVNQEVIGRQLSVFGYAHEIADNGEVALIMLTERAYGLLLSDVHMPHMDGYELTRTIRKNEKKTGAHLPIVAITANALQGEGDRCLEAGMDAYMSKPARMKDMRNCLEKWIGKKASGKASPPARKGTAGSAALGASKTADEVVQLDDLIELLSNDEDVINSILSKFPAAAEEEVGKIESAHNAGEWAEIGQVGHKLKGSSLMIGANQLADICEGLEAAGTAGDEAVAGELITKLRPALKAVIAFIQERTNA